jgi:hypothetical protein
MDNPVDHVVDLGLVNYVKHPSDPNYIVFRFADHDRAATFRKELDEVGIWFEESEQQVRSRMFVLFGIHKNDFKHVQKLNFMVEAQHKKPFIPFKPLRYFIVLLSAAVMTLAIVGYCKRQEKLRMIEETGISVNSIDQSQ